MADLSITAANVVASSSAKRKQGVAGETIAAGKSVYLNSTSKKWMLADSNSGTAEARISGGVALNGASLDQPLVIAYDGDVTIGATLVAGTAYYQSETAGGIQPQGDLGSGENVCLIGIAKSASVLAIGIQNVSVTL